MFIYEDVHIVRSIIQDAIKDLQLQLQGRVILTEAGTSIFAFTPIIALMAGAEKVYALSNTTRYGRFEEIKTFVLKTVKDFGLLPSRISIERREAFRKFDEIDIVTNLGHVRPINELFLSCLNPNKAVISNMCESWEHRKQDIDIVLCQQYNIPVAGINEEHSLINCFRESGLIALKLILESRISPIGSKISIISRDKFGYAVRNVLRCFHNQISIISDIENINFDRLSGTNIVVVADYLYENTLIGNNGLISPIKLKKISPNVKVIQLCGHNDLDSMRTAGISFFPNINLPPIKMSYTLESVSYKAVVRLHAGGLKVGEILHNAKKKGRAAEYIYSGDDLSLIQWITK